MIHKIAGVSTDLNALTGLLTPPGIKFSAIFIASIDFVTHIKILLKLIIYLSNGKISSQSK